MFYEEGLAYHFGLRRRCDRGNNVVLSVRWEGNAGQLLSSEIIPLACRPCPDLGKATSTVPPWRGAIGRGGVFNLCMCGNSKRENREIPSVSNWPFQRGSKIGTIRKHRRWYR